MTKIKNKLDPNQVKMNIAFFIGSLIGWTVRRYVTSELGVDATFLDAIKEMVVYVGGPTAAGVGIIAFYEKVYRPWKENK